jgi:hypothetical protein
LGYLVLQMDDNRRRAMYDGFNSVTLGHSKEWVRVAKQFVDLAFFGGPRVVKCPCTTFLMLSSTVPTFLMVSSTVPTFLMVSSTGPSNLLL